MNVDMSQIPKAEMHLHMEGAMRRDTYVELRRRDEPSYALEQSPWHDAGYRFRSLGHFLESASPSVIKGPEDYKRIAFELFQDLRSQNVVYTEVSVASHRVPIIEITQAINEAWHEAIQDGSIDFGILVGLFRSDPAELASSFVKQGIDARQFGVVGVDLLEQETANHAAVFRDAFGIAREAGLGLRAHAGEGAGPERVWEAIRDLGVSRIAHGTRAIEDPALVNYITENGITLDMCPTSNYRLGVVDSIHKHPVRRFFDSGVKVTVSSDDPLFFNSDLTGELSLLQKIFDFNIEEIFQLTRNAIDGAFLSPEKKSRIYNTLDKVPKYGTIK